MLCVTVCILVFIKLQVLVIRFCPKIKFFRATFLRDPNHMNPRFESIAFNYRFSVNLFTRIIVIIPPQTCRTHRQRSNFIHLMKFIDEQNKYLIIFLLNYKKLFFCVIFLFRKLVLTFKFNKKKVQ